MKKQIVVKWTWTKCEGKISDCGHDPETNPLVMKK
jgi:hypothetical protein